MKLWHYADYDPGGCFHYREAVPLLMLAQRGHTIHTSTDLWHCRPAQWDGFLFARGYDLADPRHADLPLLLAEIRDAGVPILYDVDDATDLVPPWQAEYLAIQCSLPSYYYLLHTATLVTTTTDRLAAHLRFLGASRVVVLPNTMTPAWKLRRPALHDGPVRVGVVGSVSHMEDVTLWLEALALLDRSTCQPVLMGIGRQADQDIPAYFLACRTAPDRRHRDWLPVVDRFARAYAALGDWVEWHPVAPMPAYWAAVASLRLDIGCSPLVDSPFTRCKSHVKAIEYMTRGTLAVASPFLHTGDPVVRVEPNTPEGWAECLTHYLTHPEDRLGLAVTQQEWTRANRDPAIWAAIRERTYRLVCPESSLTTGAPPCTSDTSA